MYQSIEMSPLVSMLFGHSKSLEIFNGNFNILVCFFLDSYTDAY